MSEHRQRLSAEERQEEIIRAAVDLAGERGVDSVTTQDMADAVGITQGAIFRHFPTKDMIWLGVIHWVRGRLMSVLDMAADQGRDPLDSLEKMFFAHLGFVDKVPAIPKLVFTDQLLKKNPRIKELIRSILADYEARVISLLVQCKEQNLVRPDLDEHGAAVMFTGIIQGLVMRVSIIEARKSLVVEGALVYPIFLHGIGGVRASGSGA
ncbi:MAG: TetR/AcrR family transcriptional regulator [Gammaproteobacteria bacterium]|nr:TetR/AcrR family transcriptional regulator [Gammaproteobacteria bacterium]MBU1732551.1 TetR/AcrR family transcriptional regulator [Gammaproteobacteria bacterium]MBU1893414.1 TetR/AcrR family transcriptional regulator [Gammaproteobacteria bacterium]